MRTALLVAFVVLGSLMTACGGGGGGGDPEVIALFEVLIGGGGDGDGVDADYEVFIEYGDLNERVSIGFVTDADNGLVLDLDPQHPVFAELVDLLTNGETDPIGMSVSINTVTFTTGTVDTETTKFQTPLLPGPDLIGATIRRIGCRVDAVEISTTATRTIHSFNFALVISGFVN